MSDHRRPGLVVRPNGEVWCDMCGSRGQIPHHLGLIFWTFWRREQLSEVLQEMQL